MARIAPAQPPYDPPIAEALSRIMPPGLEPLVLFRTMARSPRVFTKMFAGGLLDKGPLSLRQREVAIENAPEGAEGTPEDQLLERELGEALANAVGALSAADAATIAAALDRERSGAMGVAAATFRKRLQRALARLRAAWHEGHGHE